MLTGDALGEIFSIQEDTITHVHDNSEWIIPTIYSNFPSE